MSQWPFVIAAYALAVLGTIAITLWSFAAMRRAELAWRRELAAQTLADLIANAPAAVPGRTRRFYEHLGG